MEQTSTWLSQAGQQGSPQGRLTAPAGAALGLRETRGSLGLGTARSSLLHAGAPQYTDAGVEASEPQEAQHGEVRAQNSLSTVSLPQAGM